MLSRGSATPVRFELVRFSDIKVGTAAAYLVKGLIPSKGLIVAWGPPKCGKSFWTLDLALHIALGWDYRGRRVVKGPVVYIALEGVGGYPARIEAFRREYALSPDADAAFYLLPTKLDLVADCDELISAIRAQLGGITPALIVIDTLNRSLTGSESSDADMGAYVKAADTIVAAFEAAVLVVHHCGIKDTRPRGHTSLSGADDAQIAVKRNDSGDIVVELEWLKDGQEGAIIVSRLKVIEIGTDDDGDAITSCVVEPAEVSAATATTTTAKKRKLTSRQKSAWMASARFCRSKAQRCPPRSDCRPASSLCRCQSGRQSC